MVLICTHLNTYATTCFSIFNFGERSIERVTNFFKIKIMHKLFIVVLIILEAVQGAKILGILSAPAYSHFVLGETILKELARSGHDVTVISAFPQKDKLENYTDISIADLTKYSEDIRFNILDMIGKPAITDIIVTSSFVKVFLEMTLAHENIQSLLKSNETFDLIIVEQFLSEALFGFAHRFQAPVVLMATIGASFWSNALMGNPMPYSYIPSIFSDYSPDMNIWQRTYNTFLSTFHALHYHLRDLPQQEELMHKYFPDAPPLQDLIHNASLILLNSHPTISASVPLQPNMIEIGGFHVKNHKPLTQDLKKFLDEAVEGVVYFSLGSNMKSALLPKDKVQGILNVFSKLKMKVLWKWEDDDLPGKPSNVRIEKWLPQPAVLAHKNVKVFITHGGRLSLTESLYFGKPVIGIPLFAEQSYNMREVSHLGYGVYLSYENLGEEHLSKALKEILENPSYSETATRRSNALHDLPVTQLENAINWIEYVIKHKGVPHLRNAGIYLKWYQHLLLDVVLVCLILVYALKKALQILYRRIFKSEKQKIKTN